MSTSIFFANRFASSLKIATFLTLTGSMGFMKKPSSIWSFLKYAITGFIGYIINELTNGVKREKSFLAMFLAFGGLIPWAFGIYIVFVSGFWSLKNLADGFSSIVIIKAIIFVFLGYVVVSNFYKITEIGRNISKGAFAIQDK